MRTKASLAMFLAVTVGVFIYARQNNHMPSDLRDAPADGAFGELQAASSGPAAPETPPPPEDIGVTAKSIYGEDDRLDYYEAPPEMQKLSESVASLWPADSVGEKNGMARLYALTLRERSDLCPGERYAEQPAGAVCSGTLVGDDLLLTAGHCVPTAERCAERKIVFGFALRASGDYPVSVPAGDVYNCKQIISANGDVVAKLNHYYAPGEAYPDYAVIQLDRKVDGRMPLRINRGKGVSRGTPVFVIGHPSGLPLKVAAGARVRRAVGPYFMTDLDTFGGNSGSAVFNASTGLIEGILVSGDTDYKIGPAGCNITATAPQKGGLGEAVTKIAVAKTHIP